MLFLISNLPATRDGTGGLTAIYFTTVVKRTLPLITNCNVLPTTTPLLVPIKEPLILPRASVRPEATCLEVPLTVSNKFTVKLLRELTYEEATM